MPCIIALAGLTKSGKTTLGRRLAAAISVPLASFGDQVRKEAAARGLKDVSHKQLQVLGSELVKHDTKRFCQAVLEGAGFHPGHGLVLDGIRHMNVLAMIKSLANSQTVKLVYLESSANERLRRTSLGAAELLEIDSHPVEADAPLLKSTADLVLDTSSDLDNSFQTLLQWTLQECN